MRILFDNAQFRLLWLGNAFNDGGIVTYWMAQRWLALSMTDSPFWVGATAGVSGIGLLIFSTVGGVMVDRLDRRKLVVGGQVLQAAMLVALALLVFTGRAELWHILLTAFGDGAVAGVKLPARAALTLDVVGRERLLGATAATLAGATLMGVVAPLMGGAIIAAYSPGWAYVVAAGALLAAATFTMRISAGTTARHQMGSPLQDLTQGVRFVFSTPVVRTLILMALVGESFGWAHEAMLPVMARDELQVGASGLGYLMAAGSAGAAVSTIIVSNVGDFKQKGRFMVVCAGGFGLFLILFAASPWFPLSVALLTLAYAVVMAYEVVLSTLLQTVVPDEMRGRVLSFHLFTAGVTGFSGFHTGAIASAVGAPVAIGIGGAVVLLNALRLLPRAARLQEAAPG